MTKYEKIRKIVKETDPKVILACADTCDGHTIFKPEAFTDKGLDKRVVNHYSHNHVSNTNDPKQCLEDNDGKQVKQLKGVYGLSLLTGLASMLGIDYESKFGRGSQARVIQEALHNGLGVKV